MKKHQNPAYVKKGNSSFHLFCFVLITNVHHQRRDKRGRQSSVHWGFYCVDKARQSCRLKSSLLPTAAWTSLRDPVSAGLSHIHTVSPCASTHTERDKKNKTKQKKEKALRYKLKYQTTCQSPETLLHYTFFMFFFCFVFLIFPYTRTHLLIIII